MNKRKLSWVEYIKALALIWIFFNHVSEQLFGYPMIANPIAGWPPFTERLAQLAPLTGYGLWSIPVNLLRYLGWIGDQGVQLFIIVSGFGLTWGLLQRKAGKLSLGEFYWRRLERIYPLWWGVHLLFIGAWLVTGWGLSLFDLATFSSLLGIRVTPALLYYFAPAWWYFWLLLQLYLIYPFLWDALRKWGPGKLLLWSSLIAFAVRGAGLYLLDGYLDAWSRGAIFLTRLPEFVFGISLAAWMASQPEATEKRLNSSRTLVAAIAVYLLGLSLSLTLPGMTIAPFLLGVGIFIILYQFFNRVPISAPDWLRTSGEWSGEHSYSLYLVHHPVILALVPFGLAASFRASGRILLAMAATLALAIVLEWVVNFVTKTAQNLTQKFGVVRTLLAAGLFVGFFVALLIGGELIVRRLAPQEVNGWGERLALEPDDQLGWKLIPSKVTRLRWVSYDYTVESNSLGFPGPEYSPEKSQNVLRIMVTGDAFASAEGVDTAQAWPRLLEQDLRSKTSQDVQVLNFAMTGYGPNQYAAVVSKFAPIYEPDLIVIELFVNDFQDVLWTNQDFQYNIGFGSPDPDGLKSILKLDHLRRFTELNVLGPVKELLRNEPNVNGYFLGHFSTLEVGHPELEDDGYALTLAKIKQIQSVADQNGAEVVLVFVPAPVQACTPDQLAYYPRHVNLNDSTRYDRHLPQRLIAGIAQALQLTLYDLTELLASSNECYYQPHNIHWTVNGHQVVAQYLADVMAKDGYIP
jgi:peptidoglycan/LPS O-acetylase OafA/YrhL